MNNFNFDPVNGFRDASAYRNPQSEEETRAMFQTPLDQIRDYINSTIVVDASSKDSIITSVQQAVEAITSKAYASCQASGVEETIPLPSLDQVQIPLSATTAITIGEGFSIENGGIKVSKAGVYRVSGSIYETAKSEGLAIGAYIRKGTGVYSEVGTVELNGALHVKPAGTSYLGGIHVSPKLVNLSANDIVFLCGRCLNETKPGEAIPNNHSTYLLVEFVQ